MPQLQQIHAKACGAALYPIAPPIAPPVVEVQDSTPKFVCPKCKSPHITGIKKGFGIGKALVGGVLTGGVGLLAGFLGSRKVLVTCMQCGHSWEAGKP